jgi:hypothetical protein
VVVHRLRRRRRRREPARRPRCIVWHRQNRHRCAIDAVTSVIRLASYRGRVPDPTLAATEMSSSVAPECLAGHRLLQITLAGICCALAISACGGSNKPSVSGGLQSASLVSFAVCMRSHGVPNLPDPGSSSSGGVSILPAGTDTSSPAFKAAWSACGRLLPALGSHLGASAQATEQTLKFSECMRSHGVSGFPDPTAAPPAGFDPTAGPPAGSNGYSVVVRRGGAWLAVPDTINTASPTYRHAAAACRFGPSFS